VRRILSVILVSGVMALLSASPAMAQNCWWIWSPDWEDWIVVCDEPVTPWWWSDDDGDGGVLWWSEQSYP
jgi:hypothetical protein